MVIVFEIRMETKKHKIGHRKRLEAELDHKSLSKKLITSQVSLIQHLNIDLVEHLKTYQEHPPKPIGGG